MRSKYRPNFGFTDLLFNLVVGITFLFILAFVLINPVAKNSVVEPKTEFLITVDWDNESVVDVDVWIKDNFGNIVNFVQKDRALIYLDRDDLGQTNDTLFNPVTQKTTTIKINREVISIKTKEPREYTVSLHWYGKNQDYPVQATVELVSVNPYSIVKNQKVLLTQKGQEVRVFKFRVNDKGIATDVQDATEAIVTFKDRFREGQSGGP